MRLWVVSSMGRVKKLMLLILAMCMCSGCFLFENENMMVCDYNQLANYQNYEVYYEGNKITSFKIITTYDFTKLSKAEMDVKEKELKSNIKRYNKFDGIEAALVVDLEVMTTTVDIDFDTYNILMDPLVFFSFPFEKLDLRSPKSLRNKLQDNNFKCDELVDK